MFWSVLMIYEIFSSYSFWQKTLNLRYWCFFRKITQTNSFSTRQRDSILVPCQNIDDMISFSFSESRDIGFTSHSVFCRSMSDININYPGLSDRIPMFFIKITQTNSFSTRQRDSILAQCLEIHDMISLSFSESREIGHTLHHILYFADRYFTDCSVK